MKTFGPCSIPLRYWYYEHIWSPPALAPAMLLGLSFLCKYAPIQI